jgi:predicted porin
MPVKGMRLGAFGWTGSYARKGFWTDGENPNPKVDESSKAKIRKLQQRRYAFSAEYLVNDWTFRTEYAHSTGNAFAKSLVNANDATSTDCNLGTKGNKAQGIYALVIAPIIKDKFHAKVRYDMYESDATRATQKTQYEFGLDYMLSKNLKISGEYAHIHDRSALATEPNSDVIDIELGFKF